MINFYRSPILSKNFLKQPGYFFGKFATSQEEYLTMKKLSHLLGQKYHDMNDEISFKGDVRLISEDSKLVGFFNMDEAIKKAQDMNMDIILINDQTKPAICKVMNFKEQMYSRFIKEVLNNKLTSANKQELKYKTLRIHPQILMNDLKLKVNNAKETIQKTDQIKIVMAVDENTIKEGKQVIETFKDLVKDFMVPKNNEIQERKIDHDRFRKSFQKDQDDEQATHFLSIDFQSNQEKKEEKINDKQIQNLINQFYNQQNIMNLASTIQQEGKELVGKELDEISNEEQQDDHYVKLTDQEYKKELKSLQSTIDDDSNLDKIIGDLSRKYGKNLDDSKFQFVIERQREKINLIKRLEKIISLKLEK